MADVATTDSTMGPDGRYRIISPDSDRAGVTPILATMEPDTRGYWPKAGSPSIESLGSVDADGSGSPVEVVYSAPSGNVAHLYALRVVFEPAGALASLANFLGAGAPLSNGIEVIADGTTIYNVQTNRDLHGAPGLIGGSAVAVDSFAGSTLVSLTIDMVAAFGHPLRLTEKAGFRVRDNLTTILTSGTAYAIVREQDE